MKLDLQQDQNSKECQFCAAVSKANGEDPIGTAGVYDQFLVIETPQPWSYQIWQNHLSLEILNKMIQTRSRRQGIRIRLMGIAPDREYSQSDRIRVIHYARPKSLFAQLEKQEFLIPESALLTLAELLIRCPNRSERFESFEPYRQDTYSIRDILVCTHANHDLSCGRFGLPLYRRLRKEYADQTLRIWQTSHFGGHRFAPTLVDLPAGRFWGHLDPTVLDTLIHAQGSVNDLYPYYRGWTGLTPLAQIAEREIWMKEGWNWLRYQKSGQVVKRSEQGLQKFASLLLKPIPSQRAQRLWDWLGRKADWAEVTIQFSDPQSDHSGLYHARIEVSGTVTTMGESNGDPSLILKQYTVSQLSLHP